ncbi:MAG: hypothetical protein U0325_07170 [Polyangiales bacterium]
MSIATDPPGATALLQRFELHDRRLVPVDVGALGVTPLRAVRLPFGSYLLRLRAEGRAEVRYPFVLERDGRWESAPAHDGELWPIPLPRRGRAGGRRCARARGLGMARGRVRARTACRERGCGSTAS